MSRTSTATGESAVGELLRGWRQRRRLSQLDLAIQADISTRHLSFVETGRSAPSREMVLHLGEQLDVPLRERNALLLAAGYAPAYPEVSMDSPELAEVRSALRSLLTAHEPYPAVVVDRGWNVVEANTAIEPLLDGVAADLLAPPMNALRVTLHPQGMAPRITNLGEWRSHLLGRLRRQARMTGDDRLTELHRELSAYPCDDPHPEVDVPAPGDVVLTLRLRYQGAELSFFTTVATFGTPLDVTVAELAIESFFPADPHTAAVLAGRGAAPAR